jgi:hypothetical protein
VKIFKPTSFFRGLFVLLMLCISYTSHAHQMSTSYLSMTIDDEGHIEGSWQVRLFDVNQILAIDINQDGQLTWSELQANQLAIVEYLRASLSISSDQECFLIFDRKQQIDNHFNEGYLVSNFSSNCELSEPLTINYQAFFDIDSDHKAIVNIDGRQYQYSRVISYDNPILRVDLLQSQLLATFNEYTYQGIIHIWQGTDHILFLLALLLTCGLFRKNGTWLAITKPTKIFRDTAWIVTAFTLAHTITLTATAAGLINLESRWVELGIAVSVLMAALNNVWPVVLRLGWITFAFGLLHGMGFAGVLAEVGLPSSQKLLAIFAFNLGVEIGQLVILIIVLPLLFVFSQQHWYRRWGVQCGSLAIGVMAIKWSIERF